MALATGTWNASTTVALAAIVDLLGVCAVTVGWLLRLVGGVSMESKMNAATVKDPCAS